MISPATIAVDLAAAGVGVVGVSAAVYFFISRRKKDDTPASSNKSVSRSLPINVPKFNPDSPPKPKPKPIVKMPAPTPSEPFVIGLSSTTVTELPDYDNPQRLKKKIEPIGLTIESVGLNLDDYVKIPEPEPEARDPEEVRQERLQRLEEELQFATGALLDANMCEGMVVVDGDGEAIWTGGELMSNFSAKINVNFVKDHAEKEVIQVNSNARVPYFADSVRSVIHTSLGTPRSALVLGSSEDDKFDGDREKRILEAIASRLALFLNALSDVDAVEEAAAA